MTFNGSAFPKWPPTGMEATMTERVIEAFILTCISLVAMVGNVCLWLIILRDKTLKTSSNALILCLSSADLLVSAINMPVAVASIIIGRWFLSQTACIIFGLITMLTFIASVMSLGVISLNRYFLICHPILFKQLYTKTRTGLMIVGTWILSFTLAFPPLIGWSVYDYLPNQSFCFCDWKTSQTYTIFMVVMCFGGPCSVMTFSYIAILRKVRASKKKVAQSSRPAPSTYGNNSPAANPSASAAVAGVAGGIKPEELSGEALNSRSLKDCENRSSFRKALQKLSFKRKEGPESGASKPLTARSARGPISPEQAREKATRKARREDLRFTTTLLVVVFVFVISWLPFCVTMFLNVFSPHPVPRIPDIATLLLGCLNSSCNPIIYGVMNKRFRNGYRRLFCCLCYKVSGRGPEDYTQTARKSWRNNLQ